MMADSKSVRNMYSHIKIEMRNSASCWLLLYECITMRGPLNVKLYTSCLGVSILYK
jgi:hypothetical protein